MRLFLAPGVLVAYRAVSSGDEDRLTDEEAAPLVGCIVPMQRRAAAARIAARELLAEAGWPGWSLPRRGGRGPSWPDGLVGSLSHCRNHAAAALAPRHICAGIGIDIEPAEPLAEDVLDFLATPEEAIAANRHPLIGRVLFCAKEAAFKAVHPLDGRFLEPRDMTVDLRARAAITCYGRTVQLALHVGRVIVILAMVQAPPLRTKKETIEEMCHHSDQIQAHVDQLLAERGSRQDERSCLEDNGDARRLLRLSPDQRRRPAGRTNRGPSA